MVEKKRFIVAFKQINRKKTDPRNAKEHYGSLLRKQRTENQ